MVGCTSGALSALGAGAFSLRDAVRSAPSAPYPHANCSLCTPPRPTYPLRPMHLRCPSCLAHLRCSSSAWQRHRRLGRGHLRRAVLRRAVGGSRGPERGSTSHTDAALEARVAAWPMRQLTGGPPACTGLLSLRGGRCPSRGPRGENPCRVAAQEKEKKRALWRGALWWLPNDARSIFGPPGAGKCMVVVVNGLLSNGRLPHAYYYKRPALSRGRTIRAGVRARGSPTCSRPLSRLHA